MLFDPTVEPTSAKYDDMELKMGGIDLEAVSEIVVESGRIGNPCIVVDGDFLLLVLFLRD